MKYTKPDIAVLGRAAGVIESTIVSKVPTGVFDGKAFDLTPTYDLV
jgi:hypothetical protein